MSRELKIDPEYESIIPKLSDEEYKLLEANLLADGILMPLVVWNDTIVDGHNRYKIAQQHPELDFEIIEKEFSDRYDCLAWICKNQLGRRNLTPENRKYLIGKRYEAERKKNGGDRKSAEAKSLVTKEQVILGESTRAKIAAETNTSESYVNKAYQYAKGVDIGESEVPGFMEKVLSGGSKTKDYKVAKIANCPKNERKQRVEELLNPKALPTSKPAKEKGKRESVEQDSGLEAPSTFDVFAEIPLRKVNNQERETDIEDSILQSMVGAANMFISSCNNFFTRFPKLRTEEKYRKQALEIMQGVENYITEIREDLQNESNQ